VAESSIAVTVGSGKNLHTWDRTISAVLVQDQFVLPGEFPYATYSVLSGAVATATANSHLLQIMAGASLNVRIRRVSIRQGTPPAAVTGMEFQFVRLTTAGTGGGAITPAKFDNADAASGATAQTLPTSKGTEGAVLKDTAAYLMTAATITSPVPSLLWEQLPGSKPIIIPAGTANGIAIKNVGALATATMYIEVEFVETSFV
jgi:hypothetical protein